MSLTLLYDCRSIIFDCGRVPGSLPGLSRPVLLDTSILCVTTVKQHVSMSFSVNEIVDYLIELTFFFLLSFSFTYCYCKEHYSQTQTNHIGHFEQMARVMALHIPIPTCFFVEPNQILFKKFIRNSNYYGVSLIHTLYVYVFWYWEYNDNCSSQYYMEVTCTAKNPNSNILTAEKS